MTRIQSLNANNLLSRVARRHEIDISDVNISRQIIKSVHDVEISIPEDFLSKEMQLNNEFNVKPVNLRGLDPAFGANIYFSKSPRAHTGLDRSLDLFSLIYQRYEYANLQLSVFRELNKLNHLEYSPEQLGKVLIELILINASPTNKISLEDVPVMQFFAVNEFGNFESRSVGIGQQKNIIVPAENSLIGIASKRKQASFFDPRDPAYSSYYLNYANLVGFECRSELVVPIIGPDSQITGVINYESEIPEYFTEHHKQIFSRHNSLLDIIAKYIFRQFSLAYDSPMINLSRQQQYFDAYCSSFSHDIQSLYKLGSLTAGLEDTLRSLDKSTYAVIDEAVANHFPHLGKKASLKGARLDEILERTKNSYNQTDALINKHISRFQNVAEAKSIFIADVVDEEISVFRTIQKQKDKKVTIDTDNNVPRDIEIFEYTIIGAYIYQIMDNARKQIGKKAQRSNSKYRGKITISANIERRFNGQWEDEFLFFRIKDNGPGMRPERLRSLKDSLPLGRASVGDNEDGTRRALAGVMAHMTSRGGWIDFKSRTGRASFFEVCLVFDIRRAQNFK